MNVTEAYRAASADSNSASSGPDDPRVLQAVEEYLAALEAGQAPGRDAFLGRHAAIAARLGEYLDGLDLIHRAGSAAGPVADGDAAADDLAGAEPLGDFLLVRELGRGGMGVVYEAVQRSLNRRVALKVLPFAGGLDARQLQRFKNEAQAAACMHHPNIVPVFGVGSERSVHYYAMQLIDGQTMAAMIADLRQDDSRTAYLAEAPAPSADTAPRAAASTERPPRDRAFFRRIAELGIQAAEALDYAHGLGIVHRDVKPANLLVDQRGNLWVTDFGLAHIQSDARLTMTGDLVGTLRYMSPEQALAKRVVVDHRTDVYSLGATLYELLTLEPAYGGGDRQELLRQIAFEEPRPPRRINKAIPAELETIVQKAMEKNPADRYATAKELADDLRRFLGDEPIHARPAGVARRLRKWGRRHPAAVAAVAAALTASIMVLSGGLGWAANDRATRRAATEQVVAMAQEESVAWQQRGRLPEALAAARRADGLVKGGTPSATLTRQVHARLADLELLERLENAWLEGSAVKDNHFDTERCDALLQGIFREADIDVDALPAEEAGRRIRSTTVAVELAAVLDDWAMIRRWGVELKGRGWQRLLQIAAEADPDDARERARAVLDRQERKALVALAASEDIARMRPATMRALASALEHAGASQQAEALLREVRQRRPDDFWANHSLARILENKQPPQLAETIRYYAVAVALRPQSPGARVNLGTALADQGDVDGAIVEYRAALLLNNDYAHAHYNLGVVLAGKGDLDAAIGEFRTSINLDAKDARDRYNLGLCLYRKHDLDAAIAENRKAIDLDPKFVSAHHNLGTALTDKGELDGAIVAYRNALAIDPKFAKAHNGIGVALRAKKDLAGAIVAYLKAIDIDPKYALAHHNLGLALAKNNDLNGAIAEFRKAIDLDPKLAEAHNDLGLTLHDKKLDGAITEYRKAIDLDPKLAKAHNNLGLTLHAMKDVEGAIAAFRKAIDLDPKYANAHNNLGYALRARKDVDGAIAAYCKAIALDPDLASAHSNLGMVLADKGELDGAIAAYRKAIELDPRYALAHNNLGGVLYNKRDVDGAIAAYRMAIDIDPKYALAHLNLGIILRDKKDTDGAIAEFRKAIDVAPRLANAHFYLGTVLYHKRDLDGAINAYRATIELNPKYVLAHNNLGNSLIDKGDLEGAIAAFREAINLNPKHANAHGGLGQALLRLGRFAQALTETRRCLELLPQHDPWREEVSQQLRRCERLTELEPKLPAILSGSAASTGSDQRQEYADLCQRKHLYASAARLYRDAFAAQPTLVASPDNGLRYNAACAAALGGCGAGEDAAKLTEAKRADLRKQALDWLRADLDAWRRQLDKGADTARVAATMQHWLRDTDFNGVRGSEALGKLPEAEREGWRRLWADVADTLAKAQRKMAAEQRLGLK